MPGHPLDPLSEAEIKAAAQSCRKEAAAKSLGTLRFNVITLQEPPKAEYVKWAAAPDASPVPARLALCILQVPEVPAIYEALVALPDGVIVSFTQVTNPNGGQPVATPDDCLEAEALVRADPKVQALVSERYGITDMSLMRCDPWSVHCPPVAGRLIQTFMYLQTHPDDNQYAHPLDLVPVVDLDLRKVVHVDVYPGAAPPVPMENNNYHQKLQEKPWREGIKPLDVVQPEGPSFSVDGNLVQWQKWEFRVGFNYREGVVLHDLAYRDGDALRPVLHRASLVEMAVPYADPREPYVRKCAFDVGDYGLGFCTMPLTLGCDCLGHIKYFDAVLNDSKGDPVPIKNAVCMHEEDAGLLWKHVDYRTGHSESRRSRRLVISFIATVVNYEYCFYWSLYQDGTIDFQIKLTGELSTNLLSPGEEHPEYGTLVMPGVNAQHHQHLFCARIDPAVDDPAGGAGLVVSEVNVEPLPRGPGNPYGNGFKVLETDLTTVHGAMRTWAPEQGRIWKIKNPAVTNPITKSPVAFKLVGAGAPPVLAAADSAICQRGHFTLKNLWVTPHCDSQKYPAGNYVFMSDKCAGLAEWTKEDQDLTGKDPVIWYSFGVTHIVRIEDFPVMPVEATGFTLKPFGFFTGNPGVDIPYEKNAASALHANGSSCCKA